MKIDGGKMNNKQYTCIGLETIYERREVLRRMLMRIFFWSAIGIDASAMIFLFSFPEFQSKVNGFAAIAMILSVVVMLTSIHGMVKFFRGISGLREINKMIKQIEARKKKDEQEK